MVKILYDESGLPIAPESCSAYGDMLKHVDRKMVASTVKMALEAHESALTSVRQGYEDCDVNCDEIEEIKELKATVEDLRSYYEALVPTEASKRKVDDELARFTSLQQSPEATAEAYQAETTSKLDAIHGSDPLDDTLRERYERIARQCRSYDETSVLCESGAPVLKHVIESYPRGVEGFAEDLRRGTWTTHFDPALRPSFLQLVDEVCSSPAWDDARTSVLLVATRFASLSVRYYWHKVPNEAYGAHNERASEYLERHDADNFVQVQALVKQRVETLTETLTRAEAEMRASGDFARLATLGTSAPPPRTPTPTPLRQDAAPYLGSRRDYVERAGLFALEPTAYPGQGTAQAADTHAPKLYLCPEELLSLFDDDIARVARGYLAMSRQVYDTSFASLPLYRAAADDMRFTERLADTQPYALYLITTARKVVASFDDRLASLFGADYESAPIKGMLRCNEKVREDYATFAMPSAAHLLDVVRGLVKCATVDDLVRAYELVEANFTVLRVKNGFQADDAAYGFRQILLNVKVPVPGDSNGASMICEIQLNLAAYVRVKHQIHRFYSLLRCETEAALDLLLRKKAHPF